MRPSILHIESKSCSLPFPNFESNSCSRILEEFIMEYSDMPLIQAFPWSVGEHRLKSSHKAPLFNLERRFCRSDVASWYDRPFFFFGLTPPRYNFGHSSSLSLRLSISSAHCWGIRPHPYIWLFSHIPLQFFQSYLNGWHRLLSQSVVCKVTNCLF